MGLLKTLVVGVGASLLMAMPVLAQSGAGAPPPAATAAAKAGAPAKKSAADPAAPASTAPRAAAGAAPSPGPAGGAAQPGPGGGAAQPGPAGGAAQPGPAAPQPPPGSAPPPAAGAPQPFGAGPAPAIAAAPGAPGAPPMDGPTYAVRLRDLEQRIDELKEQIRRSHTRLSLLSDTILSGGGAGSRANVRYRNELSSLFRVRRLLIVLDGAVWYNKTDQSGVLAEATEIPIFNGSIPPGDHTLQVLVGLQGEGYGVFSYVRSYHMERRSTMSFTAVEGKTINLEVVAYEQGSVTTAIEQRPAIRYNSKIVSGLTDASGAPAPAAAPPPAPAAR